VKAARWFAGGFWSLQNTCKWAYSSYDAFPQFSGYLLGLLHGCCTQSLLIGGGLLPGAGKTDDQVFASY
jgi:hypothetical protein